LQSKIHAGSVEENPNYEEVRDINDAVGEWKVDNMQGRYFQLPRDSGLSEIGSFPTTS
jgi:hypothetical protein